MCVEKNIKLNDYMNYLVTRDTRFVDSYVSENLLNLIIVKFFCIFLDFHFLNNK